MVSDLSCKRTNEQFVSYAYMFKGLEFNIMLFYIMLNVLHNVNNNF